MAYATAAIDAFGALGDPTRRTIFERLAHHPAAVGDLAAGLPVSRPAVSQHLRVLKDAGLVMETAQGARRIYSIDPRGVGAMRDWLDAHWDGALAAFKTLADDDTSQEPDQ